MAGILLDLLLPPRCPACGAPATGLCLTCQERSSALALPGLDPVALAPGVLAVSAYAYDGVIADAIRTSKTPGRHHALPALGELMWARVEPVVGPLRGWPRTWVPSTPRRRRERGADVARLLAGPGAVASLQRVRQAYDQTELAAVARRRAPRGDFRALSPVGEHMVLVDDVRTTGATARAAALALRRAGARRVMVVTLAAARTPAG